MRKLPNHPPEFAGDGREKPAPPAPPPPVARCPACGAETTRLPEGEPTIRRQTTR